MYSTGSHLQSSVKLFSLMAVEFLFPVDTKKQKRNTNIATCALLSYPTSLANLIELPCRSKVCADVVTDDDKLNK